MKTVALISQKGGAGKSTIAIHLAVAAHLADLRTGIVDLDKQASATKWAMRRDSDPEVVSNHAPLLPTMLKAAEGQGADLVFIDTAGHAADESALIAARHADLILIPCRPSILDIEAIMASHQLAALTKKPAFVVFSAVPSRADSLLSEAREGLKTWGVEFAPTVIQQRAAFAQSLNDGRTALEHDPTGKAAKEALALLKWTCSQVDLSIGRPVNRKAA